MAAASVYFRHRLRYALLGLLFVNLILTVVRQVFDLLGYVWSPIAANFLNIIFVIFAIFAAAQFRTRFFIVYICWTPFWLAWNSFLICYYLNIGVLDRDDTRPLSWGTGGKSWWSRHTPGCQRIYNATSATVEIGECQFIHPSYVEIIQAAVHVLLTLIILVLTAVFVYKFPRKLIGEPYSSLPRKRSTTNRPHVTVEIGPTPPSISAPQIPNISEPVAVNPADTSFARSSDLSSGYLNVSYDASPAARKLNGGPIITNGNANGRPPPPQPLQNYRRNSHKRKSSNGSGGNGSVQRRTRDRSRDKQQNHHDLPATNQNRSPRSTFVEEQPKSRASSLTGDKAQDSAQPPETIRTASIRQSQRLSRPVQDLGDLLSNESSTTPPSRATTALVDASDSASSSPVQEEIRRPPIVRAYKRDPNSGEHSSNVIDYSMEPRRIGASSSCNGISNRQPAPLEPFRPSDPVRRSVISFDPKSDGDTLLRFHDHLARSQETILSRASTSTQQNQAQHRLQHLIAPDVVSFDSGLPPSHGAGSDDDPRLSRDSQILSNSYARQQQRQPIGYEPAFMMSYEPASSQDEPIYRPSFLKSGTNGPSPVKFRYDDKNGSKFVNPASGIKMKDNDYVKPNSLTGNEKNTRPVNGNTKRTKEFNGHSRNGHSRNGQADTASNASSESEESSVAGLAVPRINNSSLLV